MLQANSLLPDAETGDPEEEFELLDLLGQGAYGSVSKALHKRSAELYAVKMLSASSLSEINSIKKQIQILKMCDDEHIVKYYGSYLKDNNLWIVLQYCQAGSIIDLLNITQRSLNEYEIASILQSVLRGLAYLHAHKKIHRDIKAANVLLSKEGIAKLADFGVSTQSLYTNAGHRSQVGSPYWMSPEVMKHSQYTSKTDIWSLGVTAIELAEGKVPNSHLKPLIAMWQLKDKPVQGLNEPRRWSQEFNEFVRECLHINPSQRPEAKKLLEHPFILKYSRGQALIEELVQNSLEEIDDFRRGQEYSRELDNDIIGMLDSGGFCNDTRTIVNPTERSRESKEWAEKLVQEISQPEQAQQSSMIVKEAEGSMIVKDEGSMIVREGDNSMLARQDIKGNNNFLTDYIKDLKSSANAVDDERLKMKEKIAGYDEQCLEDLQKVFQEHRSRIVGLLHQGEEQFFGMDTQFIKNQIKSKLMAAQSIKDFLTAFPKYSQTKEFQRSTTMAKKKSQFSQKAHHSTQTNDPGYIDMAQFRQNPRGVKSQEFPQRQFKSSEKQHCFYSKSIISDIENVKCSRDGVADEVRPSKYDKPGRRFMLTEPQQWREMQRERESRGNSTHKVKLREQFLDDPDVKESLMKHMNSIQRLEQTIAEPRTAKYDRVQSTLYHGEGEDELKQTMMPTIGRRETLFRPHFQQQLTLGQYEEEDLQASIPLPSKMPSHKHSKQLDPHKKEKKKTKKGVSTQKRGRKHTNQKRGGK